MRNFKRVCLFLAVNLAVIFLARMLFYTPTELTQLIHEFEQEQCNAVVLGQSHSEAGVNPYLLSDSETKVFTLSRGNMTQDRIYTLLRRLNVSGRIKRVYLDMDSSAWNKTGSLIEPLVNEGGHPEDVLRKRFWKYMDWDYVYRTLFEMPFNNVLFDYSFAAHDTYQKAAAILENRYKSYSETMNTVPIGKRFDVYTYEGRGFLNGDGNREMVPANYGFQPEKVTERRLTYFEKIVDYCRDNDIEVVCFTVPLQPQRIVSESQDQAHAYFSELCRKYGLPYYDFNYVKAQYLPRGEEDYIDPEGHVKGELANRLTLLFREILDSENPESYFETDYAAVVAGLQAMTESPA